MYMYILNTFWTELWGRTGAMYKMLVYIDGLVKNIANALE